ncbi:MAG: ParB/RepB/Spo0J family partition protein [Pelagimonas sp.]|uniref:ParB/RepB/Spo0J family partition protein n=1 Tax=Pelagimonas sp. TaxID=2073170 RepID=UPI003D6B11FA
MARRRKLTAPSSADLNRIEEEFRRETSGASPMAPIAQVAAEAAQSVPVTDPDVRAENARNASIAKEMQKSEAAGLLIREIPLEEINPEDMVRDRAQLAEADMMELRTSIAASGLRLPIELYELDKPDGNVRYGILSGYRRFKAVQALLALTTASKYSTIKALIRQPGSVPDAFAAMVEENEIRAGLSPFERGRISSIAVQMGVFASTEESVNKMFSAASKAKRSKIRSFALIFEELGDLLAFPEALSEKQGLRVAAALRGGAETALREALGGSLIDSASAEWAVLEPEVAKFEDNARDDRKGGRPTKKARIKGQGAEVKTSTGYVIKREEDSRGYVIRIGGRAVDNEMMDVLVLELQRLLERP